MKRAGIPPHISPSGITFRFGRTARFPKTQFSPMRAPGPTMVAPPTVEFFPTMIFSRTMFPFSTRCPFKVAPPPTTTLSPSSTSDGSLSRSELMFTFLPIYIQLNDSMRSQKRKEQRASVSDVLNDEVVHKWPNEWSSMRRVEQQFDP